MKTPTEISESLASGGMLDFFLRCLICRSGHSHKSGKLCRAVSTSKACKTLLLLWKPQTSFFNLVSGCPSHYLQLGVAEPSFRSQSLQAGYAGSAPFCDSLGKMYLLKNSHTGNPTCLTCSSVAKPDCLN